MKKAVALMVTGALILSFTACNKPGSTGGSGGDQIFACDSGNLIGFEGVYADGSTVTLLFDETVVFDRDNTGPGFGYCFERGSFLERDYITVFAGDEEYRVQGDDITVDADEMTMVFDVDDIDTDEITGVHFFASFEVSIDFEEGVISGFVYGGDCREEFTQIYNAGRDSWGEVEWIVFPEPIEIDPETYVEPVQPDVEPVIAGGFVAPYIAEYIPDEWMPELDQYLFGMVDLEGNVVYEPEFSSVQYIEDCGVYIVGGDVDGVTKYGLMSCDGTSFTGLNYDGAYYDLGDYEDDYGEFLMTTYSDGILQVTYFDHEIRVRNDNTEITVDESVLPYTGDMRLSVCHIFGDGALIMDRAEFYTHYVMIDVTTGQMLYDFDQAYDHVVPFGDAVITDKTVGGGVSIYDYNGECIFDDEDATGLKLSDYLFAVASGDTLEVLTRAGFTNGEITIDPDSEVDMVGGFIAVCHNGTTVFYDDELEEVAEADIDIDDGYMPGRYTGGGDSIFFVSFDEDTLSNISTGDSISTEEGYFYSNYDGFIFADNRGDGNTDEHGWRLYDSSLNPVFEQTGFANVYEDRLTGERYIVSSNDDVTSIYSIDSQELVLTLDGNYAHYSASIYGGIFVLLDGSNWNMVNSDGEVLFSCEYA